ncbi:MAG: tetratricopeptide repeat protein [Candidatus Obscuribacterales bacterium]
MPAKLPGAILKAALAAILLWQPAICLAADSSQAIPESGITQEQVQEQIQEQEQEPARKPIEVTTEAEAINITYDVGLARDQVKAYPDDPEAHFVLAVALTRTSQVEEAWKEVNISRRLAQNVGGPEYFNKMIDEYEGMLVHSPDDNKVRYHLAWAYYMKAYLLTEYSRKVYEQKKRLELAQAKNADKAKNDEKAESKPADWQSQWVDSGMSSSDSSSDSSADSSAGSRVDSGKKAALPASGMESVIDKAEPQAVPVIKGYYQKALDRLDEILAREPGDLWSTLYRAHLQAECTGDLASAMRVWKRCQEDDPGSPAPYFFLGEGYLKQGNLRESLSNVSKAVALRALGR